MLNEDRMKGEVHLKWYEDGRMSLGIPNDPIVAYGMLHAALDEVQERMYARKQSKMQECRNVLVPTDGAKRPDDWGG